MDWSGTAGVLARLGPGPLAQAWLALRLASLSLCLQILLGHPPPYAADVTAQVPMAPVPATVLSPPLPEVLPPAVPELPQLPSSLAPAVVVAPQSLPVQTAPLLPPATQPPPPSGPGIASPCPAVQLTVEPAPEVCAPALRAQPLTPDPSGPLCGDVTALKATVHSGRQKRVPWDGCCNCSLLSHTLPFP